MDLSVLGGDGGSGHTPVNVRGGAGTILQLIGTGDPLDLAGLKVGALSEWETHWSVVVNCTNHSTNRGQGTNPTPHESVPQPDQELTSVYGSEAGGCAVVGAEVIPETVLLCCLAGGRPADTPVLIGAVPDDGGEGGAVHWSVSVELG